MGDSPRAATQRRRERRDAQRRAEKSREEKRREEKRREEKRRTEKRRTEKNREEQRRAGSPEGREFRTAAQVSRANTACGSLLKLLPLRVSAFSAPLRCCS
jgi:hypothetical protein